MFVVARDGEIAENIEKAEKVEKVQLAYNLVRESYSIEATLSRTGTVEIDEYETLEEAQHIFNFIILPIEKGDKVFFMQPEDEITAEIICEMMDKTPITIQKNEQG